MDNETVKPIPTLTPKEIERFWAAVKKAGPDECWIWQKSHQGSGYGQMFFQGRNFLAHRLAWVITNGHDIPGKLYLRHKCDNPICVNPNHLTPGTQKQNMSDCRERGRFVPPPRFVGENHPMAKLTNAQTLEVANSPLPNRQLADTFGINISRVRIIKKKYGAR